MNNPIVYRNRDFLADLSDRGRGIQSIVYLSGTATVHYYEFATNGETVHPFSKLYDASDLPEKLLREKYVRVWTIVDRLLQK